ncbi:MAG: nucleoside hydrolase-like domain-containing protein [Lewinella sp.]
MPNQNLRQSLRCQLIGLFLLSLTVCAAQQTAMQEKEKTRVLVTSDGEVDDECSMVRFLLYANEWDVEGIVTSSSQYHWHGHNWAGDDWLDPYLDAYAGVYPNLVKHDPNYPTADFLRSVAKIGNVADQGEMDSITAGSQHIVEVLLDDTDDRPIWVQAWGGTNTIARALKTIEEDHPQRMEEVAGKLRFFFIWEQDPTYQEYIRPSWGKYNIPTIVSDQFWAIAYQWNRILPEDKRRYFEADWMRENILNDHGPLCSLYAAHEAGSHGLSGDTDFEPGDFRSEGDSPAFLHTIDVGLRSLESPDYGGWGGRYVRARENTWFDPFPDTTSTYPAGRYYTGNAWGRVYMRETYPERQDLMEVYFRPLTRWTEAMQRDFAARADWCVRPPEESNHPPVVALDHPEDLTARPGETIRLSAAGTTDPDGDALSYRWWYHKEPSDYHGTINIAGAGAQEISFSIPKNAAGNTLHLICEVTDGGSPALTRYRRVIVTVEGDRPAGGSGRDPQQLAFPTAEGYGKYTKGGRGGAVYAVTHLKDSGPGSLRAAVEASGPRTVVFRVSGNIELESPLTIRNPYITIAGQTAPGAGICLKNYPLNISADHVIVRYLRIRPGDVSGDEYDAVSSRYTKHVILDHLSASWSVDEAVSVYHCDSITVQWSMISESMYKSNHAKGNHGYGGIWGSNYSSYHHNLLAHHTSRNPRMASGSGYTDHRNNVIYNWGFNSCYGGEASQQGNDELNSSTINLVNNYYKPGPATQPGKVSYRVANPSARGEEDNGQWYIAGNVVEGYPDVSADNWDGGVQTDIPLDRIRRYEPWPAMPIGEESAEAAYATVLDSAGAILPRRDAIDSRIIEEVRGGYATYEGETYRREHDLADAEAISGIIDSQEDVGGWPELASRAAPEDTDEDGMPDEWEETHGLDAGNPDDRNTVAADGYTMLEKYLNGLR